jgi:hypothetical protein
MPGTDLQQVATGAFDRQITIPKTTSDQDRPDGMPQLLMTGAKLASLRHACLLRCPHTMAQHTHPEAMLNQSEMNAAQLALRRSTWQEQAEVKRVDRKSRERRSCTLRPISDSDFRAPDSSLNEWA